MPPIKVIIGIIFAIVVSVLMSVGTDHYLQLRADAESNRDKAAIIDSTSAGIQVGVDNTAQREAIDYAIGEARREFSSTLQEGRKHDPKLADRGDAPVPDRLRDAYQARRLARERSGCAGEQCPK